jgi:hypothetical protein
MVTIASRYCLAGPIQVQLHTIVVVVSMEGMSSSGPWGNNGLHFFLYKMASDGIKTLKQYREASSNCSKSL